MDHGDFTPSAETDAVDAAWQRYHGNAARLRDELRQNKRFANHPRDRAKGYQALMEIHALSYNLAIAPRMTHPRLFTNVTWQTDVYGLGVVGADLRYTATVLDGRQTYRLRGSLGSTKTFVCQIWDGMLGEAGATANIVAQYVDRATLDETGRFELILGGEPRASNWLALNRNLDHQLMITRRHFSHPQDNMGDLSLERLSVIPADYYDHDEFDGHSMTIRIDRARDFASFLFKTYVIGLYDSYLCKDGVNKLCLRPQAVGRTTGANTLADYVGGAFSLADDEALVIDLASVPSARYWSFQLADIWSRALPFHERQTALGMEDLAPDADGHVRLVVSGTDPGISNWLDTCGRREGLILFRNYDTTQLVAPTTTVAKLQDVAHLLRSSARTGAKLRAEQLVARRLAYLRLMGE